jgi:hypothetical protein
LAFCDAEQLVTVFVWLNGGFFGTVAVEQQSLSLASMIDPPIRDGDAMADNGIFVQAS